MDNATQRRIVRSLRQSEQLVAGLPGKQKTYKREPWSQLHQKMQSFLNSSDNQWLIVSGLRGVGKTTLLTQLFNDSSLDAPHVQRFYFSMEQLGTAQDVIPDFIEAVRYLRQQYPEDKFLLFIDEVHAQHQWSLGCKVILDQISNIFIVCTGSSALQLQLNRETGRRRIVFKMHPLSLADFLALRQFNAGFKPLITPEPDLQQNLQKILFDAKTSKQVYDGLFKHSQPLDDYYQQYQQIALPNMQPRLAEPIATRLIEEYINNYGTFPILSGEAETSKEQPNLFQKTIVQPESVIDLQQRYRLNEMIRTTILKDIIEILPKLESNPIVVARLSITTLHLLPRLISFLATSERVSLYTIASRVGHIHQQTLRAMLELLKISELIHEIPPVGSFFNKKNTKTPKYLFGAPALRQSQAELDPLPANEYVAQLRGQLLEDTIAMYLKRIFDATKPQRDRVVEYDTEAGGADFVISPRLGTKKRIVIEVGYSKQTVRQVEQTMQKDDLYGLVITNIDEPRLAEDSKVVYVPLKYFLLS